MYYLEKRSSINGKAPHLKSNYTIVFLAKFGISSMCYVQYLNTNSSCQSKRILDGQNPDMQNTTVQLELGENAKLTYFAVLATMLRNTPLINPLTLDTRN